MLEAVVAIAAAGLAGGLASFLLESLLMPRPQAPWRRPAGCAQLHIGLWLIGFAIALALFQRPVFAAAVLVALEFLVVMTNNAKFHSLREPFIYQDFEYFSDAIRHPRLYIPFFGWWRTAAAAGAGGVAIGTGLLAEPSLLRGLPPAGLGLAAVGLALPGLLIVACGARRCPPSSFEPADDLRRLGLAASLWGYARAERMPITLPDALPAGGGGDGHPPDLVAIQAESFFDARRAFPGLRREVLGAFDQLCTESVVHGRLTVPAWGANTVRSEFAFLSGLGASDLGVHRFNPYRQLAGTGVRTLAGILRARGYRTVCIHPYPSSFYRRDVVFPALGFDEFIDIRAFAGAERAGPYVSDMALAERLLAVLEEHRRLSEAPLFLFAITMENHGPLHLEAVAPGDAERFFREPPPAGCEELVVYARHLANTDRMLARLRERLSSSRACWLAAFGDHVPIMPAVYDRLGVPDGSTDYVVWRNAPGGGGAEEIRPVESLAGWLLERMLAGTA